MIPFEIQTDATKPLLQKLLQKSSENQEGSLSFATLLEGAKEGGFVLALEDETASKKQNSPLQSLLKSDEKSAVQELEDMLTNSTLKLNENITQNMSTTELKQLIYDAKDYLKNQIVSSEGYLRSQAETLPKTLKGLADFAQKLGIDLSKITLQEIENNKETTTTLQMIQEDDRSALLEKSDAVSKNKQKVEIKKSTKSFDSDIEPDKVSQKNIEQKRAELPQTVKNEPLFAAQSKRDVSTEEFVGVKIQSQTVRAPESKKQRADETLKLLLQGEKASSSHSEKLFTPDFSTATARVIAPQAMGESDTSLESLLQKREVQEQSIEEPLKNESSTKILKAESFEVKLNEAKQMTKYLSQDVKTAIDNYKAPFTRVKVQLNPEHLGEVELTVVQRGKNLHVNLSSNNAAINALAMNANDLKVQLQNSGINNASLNFSNNSQGQDQAASQQQQQQRERSSSEYSYFEGEEQRDEIVSSLEIVVPNYA
jgi:flagellar hook-length control protein FliK